MSTNKVGKVSFDFIGCRRFFIVIFYSHSSFQTDFHQVSPCHQGAEPRDIARHALILSVPMWKAEACFGRGHGK